MAPFGSAVLAFLAEVNTLRPKGATLKQLHAWAVTFL